MTKAKTDNITTSADKVNDAVGRILAMFETGEMPQAVAKTLIARTATDLPSATWSLGNQILMLLAGTNDARGFKQWKTVGRYPKPKTAFHILAPMMRKFTDDDTGEERRVPVGFKGIPVHRYEDTEGEEISLPEYEPVTLPPLAEVASDLGIDVGYGPFVAKFRGYYAPSLGYIHLCTHDERTYWHELAHAAHDRVKPGGLKGGQDPRQEIVAETVAATLCVLYGVEGYIAHSYDYISLYAAKIGQADNPARAVMGVLSDVGKTLDLILSYDQDEQFKGAISA